MALGLRQGRQFRETGCWPLQLHCTHMEAGVLLTAIIPDNPAIILRRPNL